MHIYYQSSHNNPSRKMTHIFNNFGVPEEYRIRTSLTRITIQDRVRFLSYMRARGELRMIGTSLQPLLEMVLSLPLPMPTATMRPQRRRTGGHATTWWRSVEGQPKGPSSSSSSKPSRSATSPTQTNFSPNSLARRYASAITATTII